ncbi:MAG: cellulose binding domain-containing protein [Roseburia sp.]|nr:cellulose binding domain-containing protein [Roseburia sp.]
MRRVFKEALAVLLACSICLSGTGQPVFAKGQRAEQTKEQITKQRESMEETVSGGDRKSGEDTPGDWDGVTEESVYEGETYRVTYTLAGRWEGGWQAEVMIENTGDKEIENWRLRMSCGDEITGIWNASVCEETQEGYVIKNAGWNKDIPVNGSVSFGYTAAGAFGGFPGEYALLGERATLSEEGYRITYLLEEDWEGGFRASISITNVSDTEIEDWILGFDYERNITNIWNASVQERSVGRYIIRNGGYNGNIEPGDTVTFGFTGEGGSSGEEPGGYELSSFQVRQKQINDYRLLSARSGLQIGFQGMDSREAVTENIILPTEAGGLTVRWRSSRPELVTPEGVVNRPYEKSQEVVLTAEIESEGETLSQSFRIRVIKSLYEDVKPEDLQDYDKLEYLYLFNDGDSECPEVFLQEDGTVAFIDGAFTGRQVESPGEALLALQEIRGLLGSVSPGEELQWTHTASDAYGTFFSFRQTFGGVPVYGRSIVVGTDGEGNTVSLNSSYISGLNLDTTPSLTGEEACRKAEEAGYREVCVDALYICMEKGVPHLAWNLYGEDEQGVFCNVLLDAHEGTFLRKNLRGAGEEAWLSEGNRVVEVRKKDELKETRSFRVVAGPDALSEDCYRMIDYDRNIRMHDMRGYVGFEICEANLVRVERRERAEEEEWDSVAVSAYGNAIQAYDYYLGHFNRRGMDGNNGEMGVGIHYPDITSYYFEGNLFFGEGGSYLYSGGTTLDTVVHEFTHGVVDTETRLGDCYRGVTGAINEAYADIFGCLSKEEKNTWRYREGNVVGQEAFRNLANPGQYGDAAKVGGDGYGDYTLLTSYERDTDYGYMHQNSTIISHACYLMWEKGISSQDFLASLWYHSLLYGYDERSDFKSVRNNVLAAARAMHCSQEELQIIKAAFDEVGILRDVSAEIVGTNVLTGQVVRGDRRDNQGNRQPVRNAVITVERPGDARMGGSVAPRTVATDKDGMFYLADLVPGDYVIQVQAEGYQPVTRNIRIEKISMEYSAGVIEILPKDYAGMGRDSGKIVDRETGIGIEGLTIYIREGLDSKSGEVVEVVMTAQGGSYLTSLLPAGYYCLEVTDEREEAVVKHYGTGYLNIRIIAGSDQGVQVLGGSL